ncbi:GyrI-like domain-containing protein [Chloroflexota bacterium]
MTKINYRKEYGDWYTAATAKPKLVMLPDLNYLMIDGKGDPNTAVEYQQAVEAIYPVAYGIKFKIKRESGLDFGVMPLEGLWWVPDMNLFSTSSKDDWLWTAMILQPPVVTREIYDETLAEVRKKKNLPALEKVRFESYQECQAAQIMHIGPYADEALTIQKLHEFILSQGYLLEGKHHEIYLSDPRRSAPEKLRTIIRQPFATPAG